MAEVRYVAPDGTPLRGEASQRLAALAVPPAYEYAADQSAHIQTNGRDAGASAISLSSRLAAGARDAQDVVRPSCGSDTHRLQPAADRA
jgi:hypothetical protein